MKITKLINTDALVAHYGIGDAAKKCHVSVHALRLYEAEGLILAERTPSGRRLYGEIEIKKITSIRQMVQEGLNFEGIRRLIALVPCWKIKSCDSEEGKNCFASRIMHRPCWATQTKCKNPLPSCRECPVYQELIEYTDIIHHIKEGYR